MILVLKFHILKKVGNGSLRKSNQCYLGPLVHISIKQVGRRCLHRYEVQENYSFCVRLKSERVYANSRTYGRSVKWIYEFRKFERKRKVTKILMHKLQQCELQFLPIFIILRRPT